MFGNFRAQHRCYLENMISFFLSMCNIKNHIIYLHLLIKIISMSWYNRLMEFFPKWSRTLIEFSEFSKFRESDKSLKHELDSILKIPSLTLSRVSRWRCDSILVRKHLGTRMHSSRMHTVRCSGAGGGGVYPSMHWAGGCVSHPTLGGGVCQGVSVWGCLPRGCLPGGMSATHPPVCGQNDRCL